MDETRKAERHLGAGVDRRTLLLGTVGAGLSAGFLGGPSPIAAAEAPKRGGQLRVAILGGGSSDMLDANSNFTQPDASRVIGLHQPLRTVRAGGKIENVLAESMEANADATQWTIRLKKGVTFHNGKSLNAEDLAFTFGRITDPASPLVGAPELGSLDRDSMKVMDDQTLRVSMKEPYAIFDEAVADPLWLGVVPVGYDPKKPVGTGAFKLDSFAPGQQSVMSRFDGYWGEPAYLDSVTIIDSFASDTAAFNALQGGEIDIFAAAPLALAKQVKDRGPIKLLQSELGQWAPFTMRVDQPPFDNPDVRKAFRLLVDRDQIVKVAFSGYAVPGNDVFSLWDSAPKTFQRERDIEQAKALLKKAGHDNLEVELVTADIANGVTLSAQILARQAKDAGVTVKIKQVTSDVFFGDQYLKWPFAQDFWTIRPYLSQIALSMLPNSPYNETHWSDPNYIKLYKTALATPDAEKRADIVKQLQTIDFDEGGYIIPAHNRIIDLMAQKVQGVSPGALFAMGDYDYAKIWLS